MFTHARTILLSAAASIALDASALADGFSFGLTKHGRHGSVSVGWLSECARPPKPPRHACAPSCARRTWVPAHYVTREQQVWVEGPVERVWIEPVYEVRYDSCGRPFKHCVSGGHYANRRVGHYEPRFVQVWQPGQWVERSCGSGRS